MTGQASKTLEMLIESYVDTQRLAAEQASSVKAISQEVVHGKLTIQSVVITLGPYLTTTDNIVRARGTLLLSDILTQLSGNAAEDTAIKSLTDFYSARLGDWHCLRGAVLGCLTLLRRSSKVGAVEVAEASEVVKSALANLHVQALAQRDRMLCLELFECLLEKHADAVVPLEGDLVFGVVAAIEEEKDPRCLLLAFRIIRLLVRLYPDPNGPIASCVNELFHVVSRYFPISFNPQPGTLDGITREDLATALKEAFACTPLFAPFCIPLLLEKLSSSLRNAKLDALNYLGYCGRIYGVKAVRSYTVPVWEALKTELFPFSVALLSPLSQPQDVELVTEALSCLSSWVLAFQTEKDSSQVHGIMETGDFLGLVLQDPLVEDLISYLENFTESLGYGKHESEAASRVLAESARACPSSCFVICKHVLPRVMAATQGFRSVVGVDVLVQIVVAARSLAEKVFRERGMTLTNKWLDPLREQSENLILAFHQAIRDELSSVLGVGGLQALASFPASLSPLSSNQLRSILVILKDLLIDGTEQSLLTNVFTALEKISSVEELSGTAMDSDVGILTVVVPEFLGAVRVAKTGILVEKPLRAVAKICGLRSVARQLVIQHLTETIHLDLSEAHENEEVNEIGSKLVVVFQCLSEDILPWCDSQSACDQPDTIMGLSMEIWTIVSAQAIKCNQQVLWWGVKAMREAVSKCDAEVQSKILQKGVELLMDTTSHHHEEQMDWSIALVASVVVALRPSAKVPHKLTLLSTLTRAAQSETKPFLVTETAAQAVASMLNKWVAEAGDSLNLEAAVDMVLGESCLSESPEETDVVSGVRAAGWIGKGLAMRGHHGVSVVACGLLRLLLSGASEEGKKARVAMAAAESLGIIVSDSEVSLNKAHHAVVRPLYKQRFFHSTLPPLLEAVRSSSDTPTKVWLYRGIGHLISGTPHVALLADGANVLPLLLGTLSFLHSDRSDSDLLLSTLLALSVFLLDGHEVAGEHVSSIVKQMLSLVQYQYSVVVRETALRCLGAAVGLPYTRVYPFRTEVLKRISPALDDKKRVVRKEAVRCRQAWTLLAST